MCPPQNELAHGKFGCRNLEIDPFPVGVGWQRLLEGGEPAQEALPPSAVGDYSYMILSNNRNSLYHPDIPKPQKEQVFLYPIAEKNAS